MSLELPQILVRNSFNILGLSSSSALKEIRKRSQQLLQLAKIDEIQEFDADIGHVREFRNESEVRLALERVSGIKERLSEIFFWFDDHNIENQRAIALISQKKYSTAIEILDQTDSTSVDWLGCKNLALALMFQTFATSDLISFSRSLELWKCIIDSEDFWKFYEMHYLLHDEFGTSSSLFQEFKGSIYEFLSVKAISFYHQTRNPESIGIYYSIFGKIGTSVDIQILQPIVLKIKKEIEDLEKIAAESESDEESESIENLIKLALKKIDKYFLELDKFDLLSYSPLLVLRNDTAEELRSMCIGMYNQNCLSTELAIIVLDQSAKLVVSEAIASKIESDKKQLEENEMWKRVSKVIASKNEFNDESDKEADEESELMKVISVRANRSKRLIAEQKIKEARSEYLNLDNELGMQDYDSFKAARIILLIGFCSQLMEKGHELFDKKMFGIKILAIDGILNRRNHKNSIHAFECAIEILTDRLYLLSFINPSSDRASLLSTLESISNSLKNCEITSLINHHQAYLESIDEIANRQENENTQAVIRQLGAAVCFNVFYRRFRWILRRKMWKWVGWGAAIAFYFLIIMNNDKTEAKPSKQSTYRANTSYSKATSQSLTSEEKKIIEYLQKNEPEALKKIRKDGYSDKQIARYVIEHADDEEE